MTALLALLAALAGPVGFVPPTHREDGRVVLPVVFTDGRRAALRYPPRLRLAERGLAPYGFGTLRRRVARDFDIVRGRVEEVMAARGTTLRTTYGPVGLWETAADLLYLAFQFDGWSVLVYDYRGDGAMRDADRAAWARSLAGGEDHDRRVAGKRVSWSRRYATWCATRSMRADARGSRAWMRSVIAALEVR